MKAIIIDDNLVNIDLIANLVKKYCPDVNVVAECDNVETAIQKIKKLKPQILFLDVELHEKTAFDILAQINDSLIQVILITAHEKYAIPSYKFNVTDYILKPIQITEFVAAVQKCKRNIEKPARTVQSEEIEPRYIAIPHAEEIEMIEPQNIIHLDAKGNYTVIHSSGKKPYLASKTLKEFEIKLPTRYFIRVHASHIINIRHILKFYKSKNGSVQMNNGNVIPISANRKQELLDRIIL